MFARFARRLTWVDLVVVLTCLPLGWGFLRRPSGTTRRDSRPMDICINRSPRPGEPVIDAVNVTVRIMTTLLGVWTRELP